jgi:molecular chaperone IbpA
MTQFQLSTLDIPNLRRHAIGFEQLFNDLNRSFRAGEQGNYPPYNVIQTGENTFAVEVAVAGFCEEDLDVELKDNILTVKGTKEKKEPEITYTHKGISTRNFERTFTLNPEVRVKAATVQNGILAIALEHVIPEEQKAKKIAITFAK